MKSLQFTFFVALATIVGCDQGVEPFHAGEIPPPPRAAQTSPGPANTDTHTAGSSSETIEGTIQVLPPLSEQIPDGATLFLIARNAAAGPPLAVKRVPAPQFPFVFSIGPDDRMIKALPFTGPIRLSARIDADGNAMTRTPGDLQSNSDASYDPGDRGITLLIVEAI